VGRWTPDSAELRAVAPLVVGRRLLGTCTLVTNGAQTVAFSSAELLRNAGEPLEIALSRDGVRRLPVASWMIGRTAGIGIAEIAAPLPDGEPLDVTPLPLGSVFASLDTRGAPAGLVVVEGNAAGWSRRVVPVHVDAASGGSPASSWTGDETLAQLATPVDAADAGATGDGAPLFAWLPPDPVLGRPSEVVVVALGLADRARTFQPRGAPPIAQLIGLDDLGRALPWGAGGAEASNELAQIAGEIRDVPSGPNGLKR
jgi:hypothetical protein